MRSRIEHAHISQTMTGPTICVVEDDDRLRRLITAVLAGAGFNVVPASDGDPALVAIESGGISVLVTDIVMPNREGLELIKEVKNRFPQIRILAISGARNLDEPSYLSLARGLGADDCLAKPFSNAELASKVMALARSDLHPKPQNGSS